MGSMGAFALGVRACKVIACTRPNGETAFVAYVAPQTVDTTQLSEALGRRLHSYLLPASYIAIPSIPSHRARLPGLCIEPDASNHVAPRTPTEELIHNIWVSLLPGAACGGSISVTADFFIVGGSSLLAGQVAARLRRALPELVPLTGASLFAHRTIEALASEADTLSQTQAKHAATDGVGGDERRKQNTQAGSSGLAAESQTSFAALLVQAIPLVILYPLRRVVTWTGFVVLWLALINSAQLTRLSALCLALAANRLLAGLVFPLLAVLAKWLIIGHYQPGRYPLWGQYYLRWWIVSKIQAVCGRGVFRWSNASLCLYYRLLGAKIGRGVRIDVRAKVTEHDLVSAKPIAMPFCPNDAPKIRPRVEFGTSLVLLCRTSVSPLPYFNYHTPSWTEP